MYKPSVNRAFVPLYGEYVTLEMVVEDHFGVPMYIGRLPDENGTLLYLRDSELVFDNES